MRERSARALRAAGEGFNQGAVREPLTLPSRRARWAPPSPARGRGVYTQALTAREGHMKVSDVAEGPSAAASSTTALAYQTGFGNEFATEALPGALPVGRNSPQKPAYGLYAEQLSGTSFLAPRALNRRAWLYRIRPSAKN